MMVLFVKGPKLFKEPSSKSNKPIIINAIAHCCLAGKVNETQKNAVLEVSVKAISIYISMHSTSLTLVFHVLTPRRSWKSASPIT